MDHCEAEFHVLNSIEFLKNSIVIQYKIQHGVEYSVIFNTVLNKFNTGLQSNNYHQICRYACRLWHFPTTDTGATI